MKILSTLAFSALIATSIASAQKLPQTQTATVWAPKNVKVDGLSNEWDGFRAYNKATNIYYTISNDDKNLYLAVKATDPVIINKITTSGITFTIDKKDNSQSITFPAYDKDNMAIFNIMMNAPKGKSSDKQVAFQIDTFIRSHNEMRDKRQKIIRVGFNEKEEDMSVYNGEIKASARIDGYLSYTQELAIPLKYLGVTPGDIFNYMVELNGQIPKNARMVPVRPGYLSWIDVDGKAYSIGSATPENLTLAYPTNFKAKYTLASK